VKSASGRLRGNLRAALLGALAGLGLLGHTCLVRSNLDLAELHPFRRLWSDLAVAIDGYLAATHPAARGEDPVEVEQAILTYERIVVERVRSAGLRACAPWRTIRDRAFTGDRHPFQATRMTDGQGRARLLTAGFRLLGGVAPFLVVWLGVLAALPVLAWIAFEFERAGRPLGGALCLALACLSPFLVETLSLPRDSVAFYAVAVLALVPFSAYATLGTVTPRGLAARSLVAGLMLGACTAVRASSLLLLPGFGLALLLGIARLAPGLPLRRRAGLLTLCLAVLAGLPSLASSREPNDRWQPFWEGLGDFGRAQGFVWSDDAALEEVRRQGGEALWTERSERILGAQVRAAIRDDPGWYAGVLARRVFATATLQKLWPWGPRDGTWMELEPDAGSIDKYYRFVIGVDHLGVGRWRVELPVALLVLPTIALLALRRRSGESGLLSCLAAATLVLPVLVSTAAGRETQCFAVVYLLGATLAAESVLDRTVRSR
jgi:hypothetical protein